MKKSVIHMFFVVVLAATSFLGLSSFTEQDPPDCSTYCQFSTDYDCIIYYQSGSFTYCTYSYSPDGETLPPGN